MVAQSGRPLRLDNVMPVPKPLSKKSVPEERGAGAAGPGGPKSGGGCPERAGNLPLPGCLAPIPASNGTCVGGGRDG